MIIIPLSPDMILGLMLVLFGISMILKAAWGIDIPMMRICLGSLLIYWGLSFFIDIRFARSRFAHYPKRSNVYSVTIDIDKNSP